MNAEFSLNFPSQNKLAVSGLMSFYPINRRRVEWRSQLFSLSPVISKVGIVEVRDVQNVLLASRVHGATIRGIQKERVLVPHHLSEARYETNECE